MNYFKWISNFVAVVPGLLILRNALPLPPGFSPVLMAALQEISCGFIVGFAWLNSKAVTRLSMPTFNKASWITFGAFLLSFFGYIVLLQACSINSPEWGKPVFVPLWQSGIVSKEGGFQEYYNKFGVDDLTYLLNTQYKTPLIISQIIVYIVFLLIFMWLTLTFTILWLKQEAKRIKEKMPKNKRDQ